MGAALTLRRSIDSGSRFHTILPRNELEMEMLLCSTLEKLCSVSLSICNQFIVTNDKQEKFSVFDEEDLSKTWRAD